jgi:hypothetical protein
LLTPSIDGKAFDKARERHICPKRIETELEEVGLGREAERQAERPRSYVDETRVKLVVDMHKIHAYVGNNLRDRQRFVHGGLVVRGQNTCTATDRLRDGSP